MRKVLWIFGLLFVHTSLFAEVLTIDIPEHRFRIDPYDHIIVVQSDSIETYTNLSAYDGILLTLTTFEYEFTEIPENLEYTGEYTVTNGSADYHLFFTQLPLLKIQTSGNITGGAKVPAEFYYADAYQVLIATTGISYRGNTSLWGPKKGYDLEFWEDAESQVKMDVQFGNLRSDDDWVLDGLYNEPLRLRSQTASQLWLDIHQPFYADQEPNARSGAGGFFVELFFNGHYIGVYRFSEQIDRQLLKAKHYDGNIRGELYKGKETDQGTRFTGLTDYDNSSPFWNGFEVKYPKTTDTTNWQNLYNLVDFVVNSSDSAFTADIWNRFNYQNYLDYFIFLNLVRAPDNLGKNIYIAKYDTAYPYFYVPWDLDGTFGTLWDGTYANITDDILTNGFMDRVIATDTGGYTADVDARWAELRQSVIQTDYLIDRFQYGYDLLKDNNVYAREALVFPNYPFNQESFDYIADWIQNRMDFLDIYFHYNPVIFIQDYQLFSGTEARMFRLESNLEPIDKIISVKVNAVDFDGDSIYYFDPNWYSAPDSDGTCLDANGPSRLGYEMQSEADGTYLLQNYNGDTIALHTQAEPGQSWTAYTFPDGSGTISATVTQVSNQMVLGTLDQVKTIGLQKFNADSVAQTTFIDDLYFEIGKTTGLISSPEIRNFPSSFMLHLVGIEGDNGIQNLTYRQVMDFQPGDEIHIETTEQSSEANVMYEVDRYLSRDDYPDSTVYQVEVTTYSFQGIYENLDLQPVDTTIIERVITDRASFDVLPATVVPTDGPSSEMDYLWMHEGIHGLEKIFRNGDVVYEQDETDSSLFCLDWDTQECSNASKNTYIKGLGGPYYYCEGMWDSGVFWRKLKYYHKGDVIWGAPLITSVQSIEAREIHIFPNPVSKVLNITLPQNYTIRELRLTDIQGRLVKTATASNTVTLNVVSVPDGVYLLQIVLSSGELITKKVVVGD